MIIYRLSTGEYVKDLSGTGSKLYGGRWNSLGLNAVYATENISLAILEMLVHVKAYRRPMDYHLLSINIPETIKAQLINKEKLKKNWKDDLAYSQFMGDQFLIANEFPILKVPSAIVEEENNYIINPKHADAPKIKILSSRFFQFDKRLYLKNE
ncbi:MAG: RES family NAD+ phosphorylase [Ferruginibacter sp.]